MKVVVFAHVPPPHHGQSYMVELMLRGLADPKYGVECFHVDARFARDSGDIGRFRPGKALQIFGYILKAIRLRFSEKADTFYYVPTPSRRNPLFRDWIVMFFCRPFFPKVILHWHAAGLAEWLQTQPKIIRAISRRALGRAALSISLGRFNEADASWFRPSRSVIVPNGIPDPCRNFEDVARARRERLQNRLANGGIVSVVCLGLCTESKGYLDAVRAVASANARQSRYRFHLTVAGPYFEPRDEEMYLRTMQELGNPAEIQRIGFVASEEKARLLAESDILCFPTWYSAESFGLVLLEAMAFGVPVIATRWRSIPDLLPENYPGLVDVKSPDQIANALVTIAERDDTTDFRARFLEKYSVEKFLNALAEAFRQV